MKDHLHGGHSEAASDMLTIEEAILDTYRKELAHQRSMGLRISACRPIIDQIKNQAHRVAALRQLMKGAS